MNAEPADPTLVICPHCDSWVCEHCGCEDCGFHACDPGAHWKRLHPDEQPPVGVTYLCGCGKRWESVPVLRPSEFGPWVTWESRGDWRD